MVLGVWVVWPWGGGGGGLPAPPPSPGVIKQDKSSGGSGDTTKTRSGPQRVPMCGGERPIGAATGKQSQPPRPCANPPPPPPRVDQHIPDRGPDTSSLRTPTVLCFFCFCQGARTAPGRGLQANLRRLLADRSPATPPPPPPPPSVHTDAWHFVIRNPPPPPRRGGCAWGRGRREGCFQSTGRSGYRRLEQRLSASASGYKRLEGGQGWLNAGGTKLTGTLNPRRSSFKSTPAREPSF